MAISPILSRHILPGALSLLYRSLRIQVSPSGFKLPDNEKGCIVAFWHGRMAVGWLLARSLAKGRTIAAIASLSEDGSILSDALTTLGFKLIRGSSSTGGAEVRSAMQTELEKGTIVCITPDGPRGPFERMKYGTVRIASEGKLPIIFAEIDMPASRQLKSWDRFLIPLPFSKVQVTLHTILPPPFSSEETLRAFSEELSDRFTHA
ncbi:MAG TPA: DUF374 domain-containing protein [Chlorobium sp.]|uniref:DUF374 domain-containing protein n=1 Tax=Chlorobium phaeovibrioides (strain DSM 265 / 1930) TaxID=290318 RepID=A4SG45_CHLPM|nr:DUF374 domain-containing protein [Chlorobium sp.]